MTTLRELLMVEDPASAIASMTIAQVRSIEPSIADLDMEQSHTGCRHKDNYIHSLQVLSNGVLLEVEPDLILRTALILHDIGKPKTRSFEKGKASFHNHEYVGAKMARSILRKHGYSQAEISDIATLIALHMRAYQFDGENFTDSAIRRVVTECGSYNNFKRLLIVMRSDLTTSNLSMRKKITAQVNKLESRARAIVASDFRKNILRPALTGDEVMSLTGLTPGKELGALMKHLNSDEGLALTRSEAISFVKAHAKVI